MISNFDLVKLRELLKDFYMVSNLRILFFDDQQNLLMAYPAETPRYCQVLRENAAADQACLACDARGFEIARKTRKTYIYRCHIGLTEVITPVCSNDTLIGFLQFGHIHCYSSEHDSEEAIREHVAKYGVDPENFALSFQSARPFNTQFLIHCSHLMEATAQYLYMQQKSYLEQNSLPLQIDAWLHEHFAEKITSDTVCEQFGISRTKLYKTAEHNFGLGISEYIRKIRMEAAQSLLLSHPEWNVSEIADRVGYEDYNLFIRTFTRTIGISPNRYRKEQLAGLSSGSAAK